jgi:Cytochrome P450
MFLAFRCTSMDIIATYCFARCDNSLDAEDFHDPLLMTMQSTISFFWLIKFLPFIIPVVAALPEKLIAPFNPQFLAFFKLRNMIANQIDRILNDQSFFDNTENWTIYHHLLGARVGKDSPSISYRRDLFEEALSLLQAGSDTVGNTCTIGTFYILNDPDVHLRLFEELQGVWPDKNMQAEYTLLEKLPYLVGNICHPPQE